MHEHIANCRKDNSREDRTDRLISPIDPRRKSPNVTEERYPERTFVSCRLNKIRKTRTIHQATNRRKEITHRIESSIIHFHQSSSWTKNTVRFGKGSANHIHAEERTTEPLTTDGTFSLTWFLLKTRLAAASFFTSGKADYPPVSPALCQASHLSKIVGNELIFTTNNKPLHRRLDSRSVLGQHLSLGDDVWIYFVSFDQTETLVTTGRADAHL